MKIKFWYLYLGIFLILEALFPIFTFFGQKHLPTLWLVSFSVLISLIVWFIILLKKKLYLQYLDKKILFPTIISVFFMWIWWLLYFFWIEYSSPSIASILLLLQSLFAFIIFNLIWKEKYNYKQVVWAILMFIWGFIILYNWESFVNIWTLIMIIAAIFWTIWNFFTKKASLVWANPFFLLFNRNLFMVFMTSILAFLFVWKINIQLVIDNFIWIFLIWFIILFVSKSIWIMALSKIDWFIAISSLAFIPFLVIIFSYLILWEIPETKQILWFIPIFVGSFMLVNKK